MTDPAPISLPELLDFQAQVVSRSQVLGSGVSRNAVSRRARSGAWQRLQRGTYATFSGVPPREARLWAAVLRAGPGAVLSPRRPPQELHGLVDKPSRVIPRDCGRQSRSGQYGKIPGVVVHRSRRVVSQALPPWQLPRTPRRGDRAGPGGRRRRRLMTPTRGCLGRPGGGSPRRGMIKEALAARKRMRWREWLGEALDDVAGGLTFPLELRYVRDVERAHGLPVARRQARRVLASGVRYLDNFYDASPAMRRA